MRRLRSAYLASLVLLSAGAAWAADTTLSPSTLVQIEQGASEDSWGLKLNNNAAIVNAWFDTGPALKVANGGTGAVTLTGLVAGTGTTAMVARTLTGTANELTVTNGSGVSGNPTISLPTTLTFTGKTVNGGTFAGVTHSGTTAYTGTAYGGNTDPVNNNTAGWAMNVGGILNMAAASQVMFLNRITSDGAIVNFYRQNVGVGSISVTGSATAFNTSSDYRLKTNVKDADPGASLDLIGHIRLRDFDWKVNGAHDRGVIAHELQAVKPTAVTGVKDGPEMQAVDYSKLVPDLIGAVQALAAANDNLRAQNETLMAAHSRLAARVIRLEGRPQGVGSYGLRPYGEGASYGGKVAR